MRRSTILLPLLLTTTYAADPSASLCPFSAPLIRQDASDSLLELFRRQNPCQAGYNACTNLGAGSACCSTNAICTPDAANMVACCPSGASCTGTLGVSGSVATTTGPLLLGGGNGATTTAGSVSTTGNSLFPATTATAAATGSGIIVNASGAEMDKQIGVVKMVGIGIAFALGLVLRL